MMPIKSPALCPFHFGLNGGTCSFFAPNFRQCTFIFGHGNFPKDCPFKDVQPTLSTTLKNYMNKIKENICTKLKNLLSESLLHYLKKTNVSDVD